MKKLSRRVAPALLFLATASVVVWQNSRLTVLWDVSYILENAWRMACGDVPYRDFPFPYAPLTFLVQSFIIRAFGRHYLLHVAYAAIAGGAASVVTFSIVQRITKSRVHAFVLATPLAVLGIYSILPNPFYDPDACLVVLVALLLLALARDLDWQLPTLFASGFVLAATFFVKQNIGLATIAAACVVAILIARERRRGAAFFIAGCVSALAIGAGTIAMTAGIGNYIRWTIRFAAERRFPSAAQTFGVFASPSLLLSLPLFAAGAFMLHRARQKHSAGLAISGAALLVIPFVSAVVAIFTSDEPEIALLALWPAVIVAAAADLALRLYSRETLHAAILLIILAATGGAFLSQALWGSTYGIWPLFVVMIASSIERISRTDARAAWLVSTVVAASLLIAGGRYIVDNDRLQYAKINPDEGPLRHSSIPALRGLAMRGDWLPDFEELVAWSDANIQRGDTIVMLPGEDLFYFGTGRRPRFPVLMFDRTVNPFDAETISRLIDERHVDWVIVKRDLQLDGVPMPFMPRVISLLQPRFELEEELNNYDVWHRAPADEEK